MSSQVSIEDLRRKIVQATELETQLQNLPKKSSEEISSRIRMQLCEILSDVMLLDPRFAMRKDCAGRLWRNCFYGRIGELRSRIAREKRKKGPSVKKLEQTLKVFLDEAIVLYRWIVNKYESKLLPQLSPSQQSQDDDDDSLVPLPENTAGVIPGLHRLLIHLGDLNRYAGSYKEAEKCYMEASKLAPGKGNPYNQLAVVCQLKETSGGVPLSCVALYWYARSLLATNDAFETSKANLERLFESNREWLKSHGDEITVIPVAPPAGVTSKKALLDQARAQKSAASQLFLARFVDVHYDFFLAANSKPIEETALMDKLQDVTDKFTSLVDTNSFGDSLLCKIVAINAFSIDTAKRGSTSADLTIALLLSFGASLSHRVEKTLQKVVAGAKQHDPSTSMPSVRLVVPLVLICDYFATFREERLRLGYGHSKEANGFCRDSVRAFWSNLAVVANLLNSLRDVFHPESLQHLRLKEYDSLAGFEPFQSFVGKGGAQNDKDNVYVTADEAAKLLDLYSSSTQESAASFSSGNEEENMLKLLRFLQGVDRFAKDDSSNGLLVLSDAGIFSFQEVVDISDAPEIAPDDENGPATHSESAISYVKESTAEKPTPAKIPLAEGNRQDDGPADDVLVYKQAAGGTGPALLVPGALLRSKAEKPLAETFEKKPSPTDIPQNTNPVLRMNVLLREASSSNANSNTPSSSFPSEIAPDSEKPAGLPAPSAWEQPFIDPMDIGVEGKAPKPVPPEKPPPRLAPPPGFAGVAMPRVSAFPSEARAQTSAPPPPPGFSLPPDSARQGIPTTYQSLGAADYSDLKTANPFAAEYSQPSFGNGPSSSQGLGLFGSSYAQAPSTNHFLDVNRDSREGESLLDSSLLKKLWMEESNQQNKPPLSKNPFLM